MTTTRLRKRAEATPKKSVACPRDTLQACRDNLFRRLEQLDAGLGVPPEIQGEDIDPLVQERQRDFALAQQIEKHLEAIDRALQAADRGEYGMCAHCGHPIPQERLRVLPETQLCIKCKSRVEKSERRKRVA